MKFALNDEQQELASVVARLLEIRAPLRSVRDVIAADDAFDRNLWHEMASDLELFGLSVPEEYGGAGYSFVEQAVVTEEIGKVLLPGPYFSSAVLATQVLLASDDEDAKRSLLPEIVSGRRIATVAFQEDERAWAFDPVATTATSAWDGVTLHGTKVAVTDACRADVFLVSAMTESGVGIFAVDRVADGVEVESLKSMDLTRPVSRVRFSGAAGTSVSGSLSGTILLGRSFDVAGIGLACEEVGAAKTALAMATQYATERHQFDRPIGSFQSIKHMLADVLLDNESAYSAAYYGAWSVDHQPSELVTVSPLALAFATDALLSAAETNIQVHGGIGFTWEHDAHFIVRRALGSRQLLGPPDLHRDRIAAHLLASFPADVSQ